MNVFYDCKYMSLSPIMQIELCKSHNSICIMVFLLSADDVCVVDFLGIVVETILDGQYHVAGDGVGVDY